MTVPRPDWMFDDSPIPDPEGWGERDVNFIKSLKHPRSTAEDKAFPLYPWQERLVRRIYGPVMYAEDGRPVREVSTVFLQIGRGGRKTTFGAALGALHTFGYERVPYGENLVAASDTKQAKVAYKELLGICNATPWVASKIHPVDYKKIINHPKSGGYFEAISSDAGTQHGRTPMFSLVDELHAHKSRDTFDVIQTGANKTDGSLIFIATTAGRGDTAPDFSLYQYAAKVQRGEIIDPHFLPVIFEAPEDCDWRDEKIWKGYNPGLEYGFPSLIKLRQYAKQVEERPQEREVFKQLHLGIRASYSDKPFVEMSVYDECAGEVSLEDHSQYQDPCWLAVDAGVSEDLTAVVAAWPDGQGGYDIWAWFPIPEDSMNLRSDRDKVPYRLWTEQGFMTVTPGNVTDDPSVAQLIRNLCSEYNVKEIAFDQAYARGIYQPLQDEGYPIVMMSQGWQTMGPAVQEFQKAIIGRKLNHGGHPVLRWNVGNISLQIDNNGNQRFHKGKSRDRIDGAQAAAMAIGRAHANEAPEKSTPFWMEDDFDVDKALGVPGGEGESDEDTAALDAEIDRMLGLDT